MHLRISYAPCKEHDVHYRLLKKKVDQRISELSPKLRRTAKKRAIGLILLYLAVYALAIFLPVNFFIYLLLFGCMGMMMVFIFLNLVHEAVHNNLFSGKNMNRLILYIFDFLGANSFIWKKRHEILHHNFPNITGWDADIEQASFMRISPQDRQKPVHSVQHRTFLFLYPLYIVNWLLVRDFKDFFSSQQIVRKICTIPLREYVILFSFKLLFLAYTILIPFMLGIPIIQSVIALFCMLIVAGVFALLVLLTPHVNVTNAFPVPDEQNKISGGWLWHQFTTTNDVTVDNWFTRSIMANFNLHVAHHLFPHISYVYLPEVTHVIREYAAANHLPYRTYSMIDSLQSHLQLIRQNAIETSFFEEEL
jgi:linoleoyl-CoA desaturase